MAEIKSTLEMVLARAERLCAEAATPADTTNETEGMKAAASFLNGDPLDLAALFSGKTGELLQQFSNGFVQTLLRNITLPRGTDKPWEGALLALQEMARHWPPGDLTANISNLVTELRSLLGRYQEHKQQIKKQLEDNFSMQAAQMAQALAQQTGMKMNITPEHHPKFQEEWQKVTAQLNEQYNNAINQYKEAIRQLFVV